MKKLVLGIFFTTGISVVIVAIIFSVISRQVEQYRWLDLHRHFLYIFFANIAIHLGLLLTRKIDSGYRALDVLLDVLFIMIVLIGFGWQFDWVGTVSVWIIALMGVGIYVIGYAYNMVRISGEVSQINGLLEKRGIRKRFEKKQSISNVVANSRATNL